MPKEKSLSREISADEKVAHNERFLKVLCRRHNLFQAERVYGEFIQAKIDEKGVRKLSEAAPGDPFHRLAQLIN